jgi:hypothetical protein
MWRWKRWKPWGVSVGIAGMPKIPNDRTISCIGKLVGIWIVERPGSGLEWIAIGGRVCWRARS